ncbi:hypothetical protein BH10ACT9_BH10ACT9_35350 [soil metagenome]|jgi:hypothetical protein
MRSTGARKQSGAVSKNEREQEDFLLRYGTKADKKRIRQARAERAAVYAARAAKRDARRA